MLTHLKNSNILIGEDDDWSNATWPSQTVDTVACTLKMPSWFIVQTYGGANPPLQWGDSLGHCSLRGQGE